MTPAAPRQTTAEDGSHPRVLRARGRPRPRPCAHGCGCLRCPRGAGAPRMVVPGVRASPTARARGRREPPTEYPVGERRGQAQRPPPASSHRLSCPPAKTRPSTCDTGARRSRHRPAGIQESTHQPAGKNLRGHIVGPFTQYVARSQVAQRRLGAIEQPVDRPASGAEPGDTPPISLRAPTTCNAVSTPAAGAETAAYTVSRTDPPRFAVSSLRAVLRRPRRRRSRGSGLCAGRRDSA
jgi:hypothetical protein